jgi:hypothetical protein
MRRWVLCAALAIGCSKTTPPVEKKPADLAPEEVCKDRGPPPEVVAKGEREKVIAAECAKVGAAVAGGQAIDRAAFPSLPLDDAEVRRGLGDAARLAWTCRAVALDVEAPCALVDRDGAAQCRERRAFFHGARAPKDTAWRFTDEAHALCKVSLGAASCDAFRDAVRKSDPARCPKGGPEAKACAALAAADPARCPEGDKECEEHARRLQAVAAGGLARLASDGTKDDQLLATAAQKGAEACAPTEKSLVEVCRAAVRRHEERPAK